MALITRVSRLFRADFNAVLDQIEDPEQLLRQSIRDMEDELLATEQRVAELGREQGVLQDRRRELLGSVDEADEQLDLCFRSGKDDLAKTAVRRKLEAERLLKKVDGRIESIEQSLSTFTRQYDDNVAALESLRQKAEIISHRSTSSGQSANSEIAAWSARELNVSEDEVEIAFLREKDRRSAS